MKVLVGWTMVVVIFILSVNVSAQNAASVVPFNPTFINWNNSVFQGLLYWWKVVPPISGGSKWYSLYGFNHATLTNGAGFAATKRGSGYGEVRFDGSNDYGETTKNAWTSVSQVFSICVRLNAAGNGGNGIGMILGTAEEDTFNGNAYNGIWFAWQSARPKVNLVTDTSNQVGARVDSGSALSNGVWYHLCTTYDGSNTVAGIKFYSKGVLLASSADNTFGTATTWDARPLRIGCDKGGGLLDCFNGAMDDVMVFNRVLTVKEMIFLGSEDFLVKVSKAPNIASFIDLVATAGPSSVVIKRRIVIE